MTNLKIAYADIPYNAVTITPTIADDPLQPVYNLIAGERIWRYATVSTGTSLSIVFDLGFDYAEKQNTADYLIIARADLLINTGVTAVALARSADGSSYTNEVNDASFASATLYGPRTDDYIATFTATSAYRYWKVTFTSGGAINFWHSKLYFGRFLTFDNAPEYTIRREASPQSEWYAASGAMFQARTQEPRYEFDFTWKGLADSTALDFNDKVVRFKDKCPVFLYTSAVTKILDVQTVVHAKLTRHEISRNSKITNYNQINATFTELIG